MKEDEDVLVVGLRSVPSCVLKFVYWSVGVGICGQEVDEEGRGRSLYRFEDDRNE